MKNSLVLILAMILTFGLTAQRISDLPKSQQPKIAPKTQSVQSTSQTSVVFGKTIHDYGTIIQGANGNCEFKFTNTGKTPLILNNVTASCGCTVPDWPRGPIAPGTSGSIKVKYDTRIQGVFNKSITVFSNTATNPIVLQVKGNVTAPKNQLAQTPAPAQNATAISTALPNNAAPPGGGQDSIKFEKIIHDYGTVVQGADGNCEFRFTNNGKTPLILSNVSASCGCTVPEWPREPIVPGKSSTIKVSYNTNLVGNFNKSVTVNSNAVNATVILQIKGNVTPKATSSN